MVHLQTESAIALSNSRWHCCDDGRRISSAAHVDVRDYAVLSLGPFGSRHRRRAKSSLIVPYGYRCWRDICKQKKT